jgi:hypothetical protein
MRLRPTISLFPFLSILVGAMGVVAFMAMTLTFVGAGSADEAGKQREAPVRAAWEGAPSYVRTALIECRADGITFFEGTSAPPRFFSLDRLTRETAIVNDLRARGTAQAGGELTREQEWLFFKAVIDRDVRLKDSFTFALNQLELHNLKPDARAKREERYPILLVAADGLDSYDLAEGLLDLTSRLTVGAEPLLPGWRVQLGEAPPIRPIQPAKPRVTSRPRPTRRSPERT